jgi:proteasome accessory factor B
MPKETFISRFALILKRLEKGPATYDQIAEFLEAESVIQSKDFSISRRTLQRDIKDIHSQLNIEIVNEKKGDKRYFIKNRAETEEYGERLLESYQIVNAINAAQEFNKFVFLDTRKPKGLDHFNALLHAIRNKKVLNFNHCKFPDDILSKRCVHPLGLKESQGRWYLIALDTKDKKLKTFGLDRIEDIDISKTRFRETYSYNLPEFFAYSFGIAGTHSEKPQLILLKFSFAQAPYLKAYPLHSSQKIIEEDKKSLIIEINVYITYDLVKELLSYGPDLQVISPARLRNEMKNNLSATLKYYTEYPTK